MNDEIKAILADLNLNVYETKEWKEPLGLSQRTWKILLDYITNLQEQLHQASLDIQELIERDIECPSCCDKLTNLQQENEKIRKMNMHEHKYGSDMEEKYLIEKAKNDRAVEYIEKNEISCYHTKNGKIMNISQELLDILNGKE